MCTRCCGRVSGYHEQPTTEEDWHYNTNCVTTTFNWDTDKPGGIQSKHAVFLPVLGDDKGILSAALHEHIRTKKKKKKKENITQTPRSWHTFRPKWNKLFILGNKRQPLMRKMSQPEGKPAEQHKRLWLMFIIYKLFFDFVLCFYNEVCLLHNNTFFYCWFAHIQHLYTHMYNAQKTLRGPVQTWYYKVAWVHCICLPVHLWMWPHASWVHSHFHSVLSACDRIRGEGCSDQVWTALKERERKVEKKKRKTPKGWEREREKRRFLILRREEKKDCYFEKLWQIFFFLLLFIFMPNISRPFALWHHWVPF